MESGNNENDVLMDLGDFEDEVPSNNQANEGGQKDEKAKNQYYLKKKYQKDVEMLLKKE